MRILVVSGSFPPLPCGVGDYTARLATSLAAIAGIEITVLTTGPGDTIPRSENDVQIRGCVPDWRILRLPSVVRMVRTQNPDLVHIQYPTRGYGRGLLPMFLPLVFTLLGLRVVQTWHEEFRLRHLPEFILKAFVPSALIVVRPGFRRNLPRLMAWLLWNRRIRHIRNASVFERVELSQEARNHLRSRYLNGQTCLVVFFGFVLPVKGAELLFEIANPNSDHVVIAGTVAEGTMHQTMIGLALEPRWQGRATLAGFLAVDELTQLLSVADAVVLPFRAGGGEWNSSIHAARAQGTFVITTSLTESGYDAARNTYFARVDDVDDMRAALAQYAGTRIECSSAAADWLEIAREHEQTYRETIAGYR